MSILFPGAVARFGAMVAPGIAGGIGSGCGVVISVGATLGVG